MKSIIAIGLTLILVFALVLYFGFGISGERTRSEEDWDVSDSHGSVNGTWGTEIIVEYEDGSTENLNAPLPTFEISFRDKKVSNFKYILSSRGTSSDYNTIEIDMSDFLVLTTVKDESGDWGQVVSESMVNLDMDGNWVEVYSVQVDAYDLESLQINRSYNLSFAPSGSITYRGSSTGSWNYVPLPNWFYINFKVRTEDTGNNGYDNGYNDNETGGNGEDDRWIEVEVGSGTES